MFATKMRLYAFRFTLRMTGPAKLHAYHAGALYALLSASWGAARGAAPALPDGVMVDAPEQGRTRMQVGDEYAFGIRLLASTPHQAADTIEDLVRGLSGVGKQSRRDGLALGGNFEVKGVQDLVQGWRYRGNTTALPVPVEHIREEIDRLSAARTLTLRFSSPLRMKRPKHERASGAGWFDSNYFDPSLFLQRINARLRGVGILHNVVALNRDSVVLDENCLLWTDFAHGRESTGNPLGGAVGRVKIRVRSKKALLALVWGQYAAGGESTHLGFGVYRIEELGESPYACKRSRSLLASALRAPILDRLADTSGLPLWRLRYLANSIQRGAYFPTASNVVAIPKGNGERRRLAVPAAEDAALQRVVGVAIAPVLDLFFEGNSLAYRKGLGWHRAAQRVRQAFLDGYRWALHADFHHFFDSLDHAALENRLHAYLADPPLVALIMQWVRNDAPGDSQGLPTGSPLTPVLANLFLDDFDECVEAQGARLVRYADDLHVLFKRQEDAQRLYDSALAMARSLQLTLNNVGTQFTTLREPFTFLGFRFILHDRWEIEPSGALRHIEDLGWEDAPASGWTPSPP